ncbi:YetF domain-containing protein [Enterovirga sp.]|uniref:DUF421 domain-containing protein n=1 Tax=Enterovirga sp. TaxID=2026350 RepID=UPI0026135D88|nr:YetF domain-containing protein [Enterovirga sp.]MDB5592210.1 hypothetical protein [Enterovirga sp.]
MTRPIDWGAIFVPESPLFEIVLRGTIMYIVLFLALRFLMKRNTGQIGVADLMVIVLVSEVSQTALVGEAKSVTEAALSVGVILFWSFVVNWVSFHVPALSTLTAAAPLTLVEHGRLNRQNMRRELITYDELVSQMRLHGIEDIAQVRCARLEGDGSFSFLRVEDNGEQTETPEKRKAT